MTLFAKKDKFLLKVKDRKKRKLDFWKLIFESFVYILIVFILSVLQRSPPLLSTQLKPPIFFLHWNKVVLPKYSWIYNLPLECGQLIRGDTLRVNCLSISQQIKIPHSSMAEVRDSISPLMHGFHLVCAYTCRSCTCWPMCGYIPCAAILMCAEYIVFL